MIKFNVWASKWNNFMYESLHLALWSDLPTIPTLNTFVSIIYKLFKTLSKAGLW